jgi:hypothetical protein
MLAFMRKIQMARLISRNAWALAVLIVGSLVFAAPNQVFAQDKKAKLVKSGTVEVKGGTVGFLIGFRWGTGTLTLNNGTKLKFSGKGLKVMETGAVNVEAVGTVYNLKKPADFEGTYTGFSGSASIGKQLFGFVNFKNAKGVIISLKSKTRGVRLSAPSPGGVDVSFQK